MDVASVKQRHHGNRKSLKGDKRWNTITGSYVVRKRVEAVWHSDAKRAWTKDCFIHRNSEKASVLRTERVRRQILSYWWVEIWPHSEQSERDGRYLATDELRYDLTVNRASETADTGLLKNWDNYEIVADERARNANFAILNIIRYWIGNQCSWCSNAFERRCSFESTTQPWEWRKPFLVSSLVSPALCWVIFNK